MTEHTNTTENIQFEYTTKIEAWSCKLCGNSIPEYIAGEHKPICTNCIRKIVKNADEIKHIIG